jgi:hypothetical protein
MSEIDEIKVNEQIVTRLKNKIIIAENTNLKTKNKSEAQMVTDIKKWIEEEVKCSLNQ